MALSVSDVGTTAELGFNIGGISVLVSGPGHMKFRMGEAYSGFTGMSEPDIVLAVHGPEKNIAGRISGGLVFDSGLTWHLNHDNGRNVFSFYSQDYGKLPHKIAVIDEEFKSGDIFFGEMTDNICEPLEYPLDEVLMVNLLAVGRGLMAHGCGMEIRGDGLLFVGVSGSGKSTMAKIAMKSAGAKILNDDRTIMRKIGSEYFIYGTPWHGEIDECCSESAPLKKIFFIKHAKDNKIRKLSPADAVSRFISSSFPPFWSDKGMEFTMQFLSELVSDIPVYELGFLPEERVLELINRDI